MNDVMSALACERYYKPIYDWHASRGIIYGCDQAIRGKHPMNLYIDYMRTMKYFTAPGFDTPGRSVDIIKNKVGSSIAHLYRRPRVWLEGYHSQGWQASTSTIFDSTCHNYLYGANLLNLPGVYYSTYGGWWEWAPPCYHFRMPYWAYMKTFLRYFERLSYILSQGAHVCDVAVVNPLEPCVYNRNRGNVAAFRKAGGNTLKVTVYNTLNNHYQTIPTRYRTAVEAAPFGLLGPVVIRFDENAR